MKEDQASKSEKLGVKVDFIIISSALLVTVLQLKKSDSIECTSDIVRSPTGSYSYELSKLIVTAMLFIF